jgi:Na+/proline symporter
MSTADSLLILASSAVVRDVVQKIYRPAMPERRVSWYGKLTTLLLGAAACLVALGEVRLIFWFVLFAWSGLASAFVPPVLCALFWKRTTLAGAVAGMVTGFVVTVAWVLFAKASFHELYEMIPGVFAGVMAVVLVSLRTSAPPAAAREFDEVHRLAGHPLRRERPAAEGAIPEVPA